MTLSVTKATAERAFSVFRRFNTPLGATVTQERLNLVRILRVPTHRADHLDLSKIANEFDYYQISWLKPRSWHKKSIYVCHLISTNTDQNAQGS